MRLLLLALALFGALCTAAFAAQLSDDDYVTKFFGTTALFSVSQKLTTSDTEWWGDKLPATLTGDSSYIAGLVNAARLGKKVTPLLNPNEPLVTIGWEEAQGTGFVYTVDFSGMRPSEVGAVIDSLGGAAKVLPGATLGFRPLNKRGFYASAGLDEALKLDISGTVVEIPAAMQVKEAHAKVREVLVKLYGAAVVFDLYRDYYMNRDNSGQDVNIYVEIPTELVPAASGAPVG